MEEIGENDPSVQADFLRRTGIGFTAGEPSTLGWAKNYAASARRLLTFTLLAEA
jgi:hypothetical protein